MLESDVILTDFYIHYKYIEVLIKEALLHGRNIIMNKFYIVFAALALYWFFGASDKVDLHASDVDSNCSVVMFTADWCPVCKTAKSYFDRMDYAYCEFDVEKNSFANQYYQQLETEGVPTILIGNRLTVGFYPTKIDELIADLD